MIKLHSIFGSVETRGLIILRSSAAVFHKNSHLNLRIFTSWFHVNLLPILGNRKLSKSMVQFIWVTMETRNRNLKSQVLELFRETRTLIKLLYLSRDQHFFKNLPWIKSLCNHGWKRFYLLAGETCSGTGETFSAKVLTWTGSLEVYFNYFN